MRLPTTPQLSTKDGVQNRNARLTNTLKESSKSGDKAVIRPGLVLDAQASGVGNGLVVFNNELVSVYGATLGLNTIPTDYTWSSVPSVVQGYSVCYANSLFYMLGTDGKVYRTPDGTTWTQFNATSGLEVTGFLIAASNNTICLFAKADGGVLVSNDEAVTFTSYAGPTWFDSGLSEVSIFHDGTYFIGQFIDGVSGVSMGRSADGITWVQTGDRPAWQTNLVTGYASNGSTIVACNGGNGAAYSTDHGLTWNDSELQPSEDPRFAAYGNGLFVVVAEYIGSPLNVYVSSDGIDFNGGAPVATIPSIASGGTLTFNGSVFIYTDYSTNFYVSSDAITWTQYVDSGGYIWLATASGNGISVSSDWTSLTFERMGTPVDSIPALATITGSHFDFAQSPL